VSVLIRPRTPYPIARRSRPRSRVPGGRWVRVHHWTDLVRQRRPGHV